MLKAIPVFPLAIAILLAFVCPDRAVAQARSPSWPSAPAVQLPPTLSLHGPFAASSDPLVPSSSYPRTHWKEGGIVGGVVLGILGALLVDGLCSDSDGAGEHCGTKAVGGAGLGAGLGFTIGALIGGQFPKRD